MRFIFLTIGDMIRSKFYTITIIFIEKGILLTYFATKPAFLIAVFKGLRQLKTFLLLIKRLTRHTIIITNIFQPTFSSIKHSLRKNSFFNSLKSSKIIGLITTATNRAKILSQLLTSALIHFFILSSDLVVKPSLQFGTVI